MRRLVRSRTALFLFIFLIGFVGGGVLIQNFPLPFPDKGHRLFRVVDERAAEVVQQILYKYGGLRVSRKFDFGPTHQNVMSDNLTVIAWFDGENCIPSVKPNNAISLAVDDPSKSVERAAWLLLKNGYGALWRELAGVPKDTLFVLETGAFCDTALVFRKPFWKMPTPKWRE